MMTLRRSVLTALAVVGLALTVVTYTTGNLATTGAQTAPTPTWYHEGQPTPAGTPADDSLHHMPLPAPEDRDTANSMTNAGLAMIRAAQSMEAAADVMAASGDQTLVDLAGHWYQDARALREQGAWLIVTATSDSMVHDPDKARELDLVNLRANGITMEDVGQAMADHGRAMNAQVAQLRQAGSLPAAMADDLTARGQDLITAGEQMARDGKKMEEYAKSMLQSLGE
jgi:hypothetical protein